MSQPEPTCARLLFRLLAAEDLTVLYALALDDYVRRFLLDGERVSEGWSVSWSRLMG